MNQGNNKINSIVCILILNNFRTGYSTETYYELETQYSYVYYDCYNGGTCSAESTTVCNCLTGWTDNDCNTGTRTHSIQIIS